MTSSEEIHNNNNQWRHQFKDRNENSKWGQSALPLSTTTKFKIFIFRFSLKKREKTTQLIFFLYIWTGQGLHQRVSDRKRQIWSCHSDKLMFRVQKKRRRSEKWIFNNLYSSSLFREKSYLLKLLNLLYFKCWSIFSFQKFHELFFYKKNNRYQICVK